MGAFAWVDCDLVTLRENSQFQMTELKALVKVEEVAQYRARHFPAALPEGVPRIIAVNIGQQNGEDDVGAWFRMNGMAACSCLAKDDIEGLLRFDDDQQAVARNVTVFVVDKRFLYEPKKGAAESDPIVQKFANRKKLR